MMQRKSSERGDTSGIVKASVITVPVSSSLRSPALATLNGFDGCGTKNGRRNREDSNEVKADVREAVAESSFTTTSKLFKSLHISARSPKTPPGPKPSADENTPAGKGAQVSPKSRSLCGRKLSISLKSLKRKSLKKPVKRSDSAVENTPPMLHKHETPSEIVSPLKSMRCSKNGEESGDRRVRTWNSNTSIKLKDTINIASYSPHRSIHPGLPVQSESFGSGDSSSSDDERLRTLRSPIKDQPVERISSFVGNLFTESRCISYHEEADDRECPEKVIQVHGRFTKLNVEIGRGSFKTVFKGHDAEDGTTIAWCELQSRSRISKKDHKRFKIEADLLKRLQHPSIIRFYDYWEVVESQSREKYFVLITEFMTSGTLRSYLKNFESKVPLKVIKSWCRKILKGLGYLHSRNPAVIHRDLKCDNIFVSGNSGVVKIGDLGLAIITDSKGEARSVIGTPEFMAPEIFDEQYDELVDVYAFGMCMIEMVTKQFPYAECDNAAQIYRKITGGVRPLGFERIEDPATKAVVDRCIRFSKTERYSVKDLLALEYFLDECEVRVEFTDRARSVSVDDPVVPVLVRYPEKLAAKCKFGDSRAVQISLNILVDDPDSIVADMVKRSLIPDQCDNLPAVVARQIRDRISEVKKERSWMLVESEKMKPLPVALSSDANTPAASFVTQVDKCFSSVPAAMSGMSVDSGCSRGKIPSVDGVVRISQGHTLCPVPSRETCDLRELDEKLSTITRFSVMASSNGSDVHPRNSYRKMSDPGLYVLHELGLMASASEESAAAVRVASPTAEGSERGLIL